MTAAFFYFFFSGGDFLFFKTNLAFRSAAYLYSIDYLKVETKN